VYLYFVVKLYNIDLGNALRTINYRLVTGSIQSKLKVYYAGTYYPLLPIRDTATCIFLVETNRLHFY